MNIFARATLGWLSVQMAIVTGDHCHGTDGSARPNIVVFLVDDMGWQDTSVPFHTEVTPKCLLTKRLVNRFPCLEPRRDRRPGKRPAPRDPRTMELQI